ncbi:MAG: 2OG-Fe(II) oxygenase [Acetobacteraceae bacterium]|nr:2OG-Fe(II) oxygenase [Acetobacteraceae bacterium]
MANPGATTAEQLLAYPGVRRVPSPAIELFDRPSFLPAELCAELIRLTDEGRRPSTLADPNGDNYFRTSETCDLDPAEPAVQDLERQLFELNRIDPAYGEPVQGQRYAVGQEFKPHTDYFEPGGVDYDTYTRVSGQRTWTFMVYLNEPEAGGGTRFKLIDKMFKPETGKLLCWNSWLGDALNPGTLHHGMKVRKGVKYVITKWYRERPWGW